MATNDGGRRLLVFGLESKSHHGFRMRELLRRFGKQVSDPTNRTMDFMGVWTLVNGLTEENVEAIRPWLLYDGRDFPLHVLPSAPVAVQQQQRTAPRALNHHNDDDENEEKDDGEDWPDYIPEDFDREQSDSEEEDMIDVEDEVVDEPVDEPMDDAPDMKEEDSTNPWNARKLARSTARRHSMGSHGEEVMFPGGTWIGDKPRTFLASERQLPERQAFPDLITHRQVSTADEDQQESGPSSKQEDPNSTDVECGICAEFFPPSGFSASSKITDRCDHDHEMVACLNCIRSGIQSTLDEGILHLLNCPYCPEILSYEDVKKYATKEAFARYEYLVMKASPDVVMCLGRNCDKGQSHTDPNPMMVCNSCGFKTCVAHKLPWHDGQTCDEFDMDESQIDRLERDEATAKLLAKEQSRICPNCHQGVTKEEGCDHMMCRCGNAWCFICMASWENIMRIGETAHAVTCSYHPNHRQMSRGQVTARQDQIAELVHGGRVSDALVQARHARNERVKKEVRPLAALAAERRMKEADAQKLEIQAQEKAREAKRKAEAREVGGMMVDPSPPKRRPRLIAPWEEK